MAVYYFLARFGTKHGILQMVAACVALGKVPVLFMLYSSTPSRQASTSVLAVVASPARQ
jgi:thioester reductase-like protein